MGRPYRRKTGQRRQEERYLSVRADLGDGPDLDKLTELLVRLALQGGGQRKASTATTASRNTAVGDLS